MNITAIRKALRSAFGARKYRITKNQEIHIYSNMPNTNQIGWYLFGHVGDTQTENRIKSL